MKAVPFPSKTTPWRVLVPAKKSPTAKRRAYYFENKKEATSFVGQVKNGKFAPEPIRKTQQEEFNLAVRRFSELFDGSIEKFYEVASRIKSTQDLIPATVEEAALAFQADRAQKVKKGELAASTHDTNRWHLLRLVREFPAVGLSDLGELEMRHFFDNLGNKNGRTIYKTLHTFFEWARKYKYIAKNPLEGIKAEETGEFGVNNEHYSVDTFRRMLRIAAGLEPAKKGGEFTRDFIDLLPWFVLSGFGGLRGCEAYRLRGDADALKWTDLHFQTQLPELPNIEIREGATKKTNQKNGDKHHVDMEPAIEAIKLWLPLCPQYEGVPFIVRWTKRNIQDLKRAFTKTTGIKFIKNGFRNSFATFALSYNGLSGLGQVARQMGDAENVVERHYVRNLPAGSGKAWFDLRPFEAVKAARLANRSSRVSVIASLK
jgi:hypothetical protein